MIRLIILALALSTLSGTLGAGLAACRNSTMGPGTEADTAASAPPDAAANPAPNRWTPRRARASGGGPRWNASAQPGAPPSGASSGWRSRRRRTPVPNRSLQSPPRRPNRHATSRRPPRRRHRLPRRRRRRSASRPEPPSRCEPQPRSRARRRKSRAPCPRRRPKTSPSTAGRPSPQAAAWSARSPLSSAPAA